MTKRLLWSLVSFSCLFVSLCYWSSILIWCFKLFKLFKWNSHHHDRTKAAIPSINQNGKTCDWQYMISAQEIQVWQWQISTAYCSHHARCQCHETSTHFETFLSEVINANLILTLIFIHYNVSCTWTMYNSAVSPCIYHYHFSLPCPHRYFLPNAMK